jgi:lipoprotein-anchoring transpeptidase ErfK/SrfK
MLVLALLVPTRMALGSSREEARKVIQVLHQTGADQKLPDEMNSVDATFRMAEECFQRNDYEASEPYYLLSLQKARVLLFNAMDIPDASILQVPPAVSPDAPSENKTVIAGAADPDSDFVPSDKLVGSVNYYTVGRHDTLRLVAAKLGVSRQQLATANGLDHKAPLKVGQKLKYNNRKIIPQRVRDGIIVNIPDRTLYYFRQGKLVTALPVAVGTGRKTEKFDWQTPTGKFRVIGKQKDPTWHVPASIQSEMEQHGKEVVSTVPPGPDNPLGKYAIKTSIPGILIHSTDKPSSIYSFASHGCIRVSPLHMEDFFKEVKVNTPGEIIYKPVKLAVTEQGKIFLEVHQDVYGKAIKLDAEARNLIKRHQLTERVDWGKLEAVLRKKSGIAEDITL